MRMIDIAQKTRGCGEKSTCKDRSLPSWSMEIPNNVEPLPDQFGQRLPRYIRVREFKVIVGQTTYVGDGWVIIGNLRALWPDKRPRDYVNQLALEKVPHIEWRGGDH